MEYLEEQEIKQFSIFSELLPDEFSEVLPLLRQVHTIEGEQLIREGDKVHTFFIIISGHFMVHFRDGRSVTLGKRGEIIGWSSVVSTHKYAANVTSLTDGQVISIPGNRFLELIQANAELGDKLIKKVNETIRQRSLVSGQSCG